MSKDTGGTAFPYEYDRDDNIGGTFRDVESGMTLRDYFAAKAMQSLYIRAGGTPAIDAESCDYFSTHAYHMADAMLKARSE